MASIASPSIPTYPFAGAEPVTGATMRVAPGIDWVRLKIPGPLKHVNCWLLDDDDGVALVDAGFNLDETRDAWRQVFRGPLADTRVTRMIGTHMHPDHIGLAGWMCSHHGCDLLMTRGEWLTIKMLVADARDTVPEEIVAFWRAAGWADEHVNAASTRGWSGFRRIVTPMPFGYRRIKHGDSLRVGAIDWRIVTGSGHSPEHACLLDEANGVFIAGDQVLPRISPNVSLGATEPDADPLGEWFASIDKLHGLPADLLVLPGHGDPFTGLHDRLDVMAADHHQRLDDLEALIARPTRAIDTFATLFSRPIGDDMRGMATGEALAHLRRLEVEGRAVKEVRDGVWWYTRV